MGDSPPGIWEDDEFVYVPEEFFIHLPPEYREAVAARKQQGSDMLQIADKDIKSLVRLVNAIPTSSSLSYIYHRLRSAKFAPTTAAFMEQEMLTTAFVVTYARLFVSGNGGSGVSRDQTLLTCGRSTTTYSKCDTSGTPTMADMKRSAAGSRSISTTRKFVSICR